MRRLGRKGAALAAGLLLSFLAAPHAAALRLTPFVAEMAPSGEGATQLFRVLNETDETVAIQLSTWRRSLDREGAESRVDAEDEFSVYPPQFVLGPRETRSVRVQFLGPSAPTQELAYRLIAEQLPVDLDKTPRRGARMRLLLKYEGALYIVPPGAKPDLRLASAQPATGADGKRRLELVFANRGSKHALLQDIALELADAGGRRVRLDLDTLEGVGGENVLAGAERRFLVPWPRDLADGAVNAGLRPKSAP
jgi:fimbrial chaperone protein